MSKFKVTVTFEIIAESLDDAWGKVDAGVIKDELNDIYYMSEDVPNYPEIDSIKEVAS